MCSTETPTWLEGGGDAAGAAAGGCGASAGRRHKPHVMEAAAGDLDLLHVGRGGQGDDGFKLGRRHSPDCDRLDWFYRLGYRTKE